MNIELLDLKIPEVASKSNTDPLDERELEALMEHHPNLVLLIQQGMLQRAVDHTGKIFILHTNDPIE